MTDSLSALSLEQVLDVAEEFGIELLEFSTGNWGKAPHLDLQLLLASEQSRRLFLAKLSERGIVISALNCSGNQLAPGEAGAVHHEVVRKTIELAGLLEVERVVLMSGLPAAPGDRHPNWITVTWPPETADILLHQWQQVAIPYWQELVPFAAEHGVTKLCIEAHGHQLVYNSETLLRLRAAVGPAVGANFDPSHIFWMGGDPIAAIDSLRDCIFHVHAKDTRIEEAMRRKNTLLETKPNDRVAERSWNFMTLGDGHSQRYWADLIAHLRGVGYDDVLSIEHEDFSLPPLEGVRRSAALLAPLLSTAQRWSELPCKEGGMQ